MIREAPFFHDRIPGDQADTATPAQAFIVLDASGAYVLASLQTDGVSPAYIVPVAGEYRLNDAAAGASPLAYFPATNTVLL